MAVDVGDAPELPGVGDEVNRVQLAEARRMARSVSSSESSGGDGERSRAMRRRAPVTFGTSSFPSLRLREKLNKRSGRCARERERQEAKNRRRRLTELAGIREIWWRRGGALARKSSSLGEFQRGLLGGGGGVMREEIKGYLYKETAIDLVQ